MTATMLLDVTPPPWATKSWDLSATIPGEVVHDGQQLAVIAPDGVTVVQAGLSQINETGRESDVSMVVAGYGFSSFPATSTTQFTAALRAWADALDAEAAKVGGE